MAQILEADTSQTGRLDRRVEALAELEVVDLLADLVDERQFVVAGEVFALLQGGERGNDVGHHRNRADPLTLRHRFVAAGVVAPDVDQAADEVDALPPERQQLAPAEAGVCGDGKVSAP